MTPTRYARALMYAVLRSRHSDWPPDLVSDCIEADRRAQAFDSRARYRRMRRVEGLA